MACTLRHRLAVWAIRAVQRLGPRRVRVRGLPFRISRHVFNPKYYGTSRLMARHIVVGEGDLVLDMGTGSGIQAVAAARRGARVVAVDIVAEAAWCALANVRANGVADAVGVVQGDLFGPLAPRGDFSAILFTPPYLEGTPRGALDHALHDPGRALLRCFFGEAGAYLRPGAYVQIVYSSVAGVGEALAIAEGLGWEAREVGRRRVFGESLVVYRLTPVRS